MQEGPQHSKAAMETTVRAATTAEAAWKRHEAVSLVAVLGVLLFAVTSGVLFWRGGFLSERQVERTVTDSEPSAPEKHGALGAAQALAPRQTPDDNEDLDLLVRGDGNRIKAIAASVENARPSPRRLQIAQAETEKESTDAGAEAPSKNNTKPTTKAVEAPWIAGVQPDRRPARAPVILKMEKKSGWYAWALTGTTRPYPESFKFLEDQEAWYTPFSRPGMTGPYDLRGWHAPSSGEGS